MGSGFKDDDAYDVYDQPWRKDQSIGSNIYRPGKNIDKELTDDFDSLVKSNRFVTYFYYEYYGLLDFLTQHV